MDALNGIQGSILDNVQVITTLETLKKEAAEISAEVERTEETMHEIQVVSDLYKPLSIMSSKIYFTLEKLGSIHYLYQFSL